MKKILLTLLTMSLISCANYQQVMTSRVMTRPFGGIFDNYTNKSVLTKSQQEGYFTADELTDEKVFKEAANTNRNLYYILTGTIRIISKQSTGYLSKNETLVRCNGYRCKQVINMGALSRPATIYFKTIDTSVPVSAELSSTLENINTLNKLKVGNRVIVACEGLGWVNGTGYPKARGCSFI